MRVLLLGSGGRESALAWALSRSRYVSGVVAAPGNPGIGELGEIVPVDPSEPEAVVDLAERIDAGLVVVGPEAPLMAGVGDALRAAGRKVFGPNQAARLIEGSKSHAKELMDKAGIPTPRWEAFETADGETALLDDLGTPYVVN